MGRFINLSKIKEQAELIETLADRVNGDTVRHCEAPTVDAVEVVRCRDCKYHEDTSITEYEHCCMIGKTVRHDDFCSYGERKGGAD